MTECRRRSGIHDAFIIPESNLTVFSLGRTLPTMPLSGFQTGLGECLYMPYLVPEVFKAA